MKYTVVNKTSVTVYIANNLDTILKHNKEIKVLRSSLHLSKPPKDNYIKIFAIKSNHQYEAELSNGTLIELNLDEVVKHFTFNYRESPTQTYIEFATIKTGTN